MKLRRIKWATTTKSFRKKHFWLVKITPTTVTSIIGSIDILERLMDCVFNNLICRNESGFFAIWVVVFSPRILKHGSKSMQLKLSPLTMLGSWHEISKLGIMSISYGHFCQCFITGRPSCGKISLLGLSYL